LRFAHLIFLVSHRVIPYEARQAVSRMQCAN
jgi:hypothetical protein